MPKATSGGTSNAWEPDEPDEPVAAEVPAAEAAPVTAAPVEQDAAAVTEAAPVSKGQKVPKLRAASTASTSAPEVPGPAPDDTGE